MRYLWILVLALTGLLVFSAPIQAQDDNICWLDNAGINSQEGVILPWDLQGIALPRAPLQPEWNAEQGYEPSVSIFSFDVEDGFLVFAGRISYGRDFGTQEYDSDGDGEIDAWMSWDSPDVDEGIFSFHLATKTISTFWSPSDYTIQTVNEVDLHPDGTRVLFSAYQYGEGTGGDSEIFLVDVGGHITQISENLLHDETPIWYHPNGAIEYVQIRENETYVMYGGAGERFYDTGESAYLFNAFEAQLVSDYSAIFADRIFQGYQYGEDSALLVTVDEAAFDSRFTLFRHEGETSEEIYSTTQSLIRNPRICNL